MPVPIQIPDAIVEGVRRGEHDRASRYGVGVGGMRDFQEFEVPGRDRTEQGEFRLSQALGLRHFEDGSVPALGSNASHLDQKMSSKMVRCHIIMKRQELARGSDNMSYRLATAGT